MSHDIQQYIEWFRYSSAYINAHRNKVFVILITGEALADPNFPNIVYDISLLNSLGVKLVLVHGARPQISEALQQAGIDSRYHRKLRISDPASLVVIKETVGRLSIDIEAQFSLGLINSPMHGASIRLCRGNFITARPFGIHDGVDFHNTGLVRKVQRDAIERYRAAVQPRLFTHRGGVQPVRRAGGDGNGDRPAGRQADPVHSRPGRAGC